ncbi:hypothetical protein LCGC14_0122000 [marine sediment metagenome]|uniref:HEAT repeat domain-containing protein n=2 Tax=root TaxID=1 RepID=A0A0F9Y849_9ZZZZ
MLIPPKQIKISLITAPEFNLEYLWWLTILFFVLSVIYFFGVFLIRNRITSKNSRTKDKKIQFSPMINEFLFFEDSNTKEEKMNYLNLKIQIRELIKNDFDRNVLTEVLLDLRKDLSGQSQTVLIDLYKDLGLHNDAYEKLSSRKWQVVSSGILELTTMEVDESYGLIIKFINHRQSTIRKQAEIAVVNLKEEGIKYFLDNTKYKIAEWQQLKLLDVLRHKPNFNAPQFGLWLTATNTHVVLFSLRLIKYYNQNEAEQSIITLLKHKNRDIQAEAIECIKDFHFVSALPTLKLVYPKASHDIKIAILDAIGEVGSENEVSFLEFLKSTERHFNIKGKVNSTLNKINPESVLPTKNISTAEFYESEIEIEETLSTNNEIKKEVELSITEPVLDITMELNNEPELSEENIELESVAINSLPNEETEGEIVNETSTDKIEDEVELDIEVASDSVEQLDIDLTFLTHVNDKNEQANNDVEVVEDEEVKKVELAELVEELENELTFNFLPFVIEEVAYKEEISAFVEEDFEPLFVLDDGFIDEQEEVASLTLGERTTNEFEDIDWSTVTAEAITDNYCEPSSIDEPLVSFESDGISFSANFMPQEELDAMVILENIAELGDCRELDVLQNIADKNSSALVKERANELIQKFLYQSPRPTELFSADNNLSESVFTEIYNLADEETKLMLLSEIKSVGDEKEIHLLESVIKTESKFLAKAATEALENIKSQLSLVTEFIPKEIDNDSIFDVDFEIELSESIKRNIASNNSGSTLFDQLCSMSNSLYKKKNG